jgi:hypothetical protein
MEVLIVLRIRYQLKVVASVICRFALSYQERKDDLGTELAKMSADLEINRRDFGFSPDFALSCYEDDGQPPSAYLDAREKDCDTENLNFVLEV